MIPRQQQLGWTQNAQDTQHCANVSRAAMAGDAMRSALVNPYAQYNMSPHYYQAYMRAMQPATNAGGYTLSSTYSPQRNTGATVLRRDPRSASVGIHTRTDDKKPNGTGGQTHGGWYQPGNFRCTRQGCTFTGSKKSVEIHMMDRHFIFPPGWQKKDEWDADPSLKGKPIAIQGTGLILDSKEAIDAWIAERRNRFPTSRKVEDKKRKLEEAIARGQLTPEDMGLQGWKKRRQDDSSFRGHQPRGRGRGRGMNRSNYARGTDSRTQELSSRTNFQVASAPLPLISAEQHDKIDSNTNSDDDTPEVVSSKPPQALETDLALPTQDEHNLEMRPQPKPIKRPPPPQPKPPPRNPFTSRTTLLRNLLLPEIRITVSNLSQAIRFLVDNDFLRGVEVKPGEAGRKMIEVVQSTCSEPDNHLNSHINEEITCGTNSDIVD